MIDASRHEIIMRLRSEPDRFGEDGPFSAVVKKATPTDLRDAIKECLLSPSSSSVNRRRMGVLANALLDRLYEALDNVHKAEIRAMDAEAKFKQIADAAKPAFVPPKVLPSKTIAVKPRRRKEAA